MNPSEPGHSSGGGESKPTRLELDATDRMYARYGPYAERVRTFLQMALGVGLVVRLGWFGVHHFWGDAEHVSTAGSILAIVGTFLAASTAVELAYFLFTPGPDEAYGPVLLALATAALLLAGLVTDDTEWPEVVGLVAVVVLLVGMLLLKHRVEDGLGASDEAERLRASERRKAARSDLRRHPPVWAPRFWRRRSQTVTLPADSGSTGNRPVQP